MARAGDSPRYEIVCSLARGGMAELFLAKLKGPAGFERLVVVKRLAGALAEDAAAMRALFDEARIVATLSHANIVQVHDVDQSDGEVSIVMELLHGFDVAQLQRRLARRGQAIPLDASLAISLGVCAGLHHAHERRGADGRSLEIIHRDVSPQNVFVTYDGSVKLVDFGIARATTRLDRTAHGVLKGKPGFMAPEQIRGQTLDRRTDVWATAALHYAMTTGRPPFEDLSFDELLAAVSSEPRPPSAHVPDYPPELEAIVMRGLARDPAARYPTAEAMQLELAAFARSRDADLSPFALAAVMERAFGDELAAWKQAQANGKSLASGVTALRGDVIGTGVFVEPVAPAFDRPRKRRRWWLAAVPVAAALGLALWLGLRRSDDARPLSAVPARPQPAPLAAPPSPPPLEVAKPEPVAIPATEPAPAPPPRRPARPKRNTAPAPPPPAPPAPHTAPDHDDPLPR